MEKYLETLKFFEDRRAKNKEELQKDYTDNEKELIKICIEMDNHTIKTLKEYIAGF